MPRRQNAIDLSVSASVDGFTIGGGTTERNLSIHSGDITLEGGSGNTFDMPPTSDTLVGETAVQSLSNKEVSGSFTGSFTGSIDSASWAETASYVEGSGNADTASFGTDPFKVDTGLVISLDPNPYLEFDSVFSTPSSVRQRLNAIASWELDTNRIDENNVERFQMGLGDNVLGEGYPGFVIRKAPHNTGSFSNMMTLTFDNDRHYLEVSGNIAARGTSSMFMAVDSYESSSGYYWYSASIPLYLLYKPLGGNNLRMTSYDETGAWLGNGYQFDGRNNLWSFTTELAWGGGAYITSSNDVFLKSDSTGSLMSENMYHLSSSVWVGNTVSDPLFRHVMFPKNAYYLNENPTVNGSIQFELPKFDDLLTPDNISSFVKFEIDVFDYDLHSSMKILASGYYFENDHTWLQTTVHIIGGNDSPTDKVTFAIKDSGSVDARGVILIGDNQTDWAYPHAAVTKIMSTWASGRGDHGIWEANWSASLNTDSSSYTDITIHEGANSAYIPTASYATFLGGLQSGEYARISASNHLYGTQTVDTADGQTGTAILRINSAESGSQLYFQSASVNQWILYKPFGADTIRLASYDPTGVFVGVGFEANGNQDWFAINANVFKWGEGGRDAFISGSSEVLQVSGTEGTAGTYVTGKAFAGASTARIENDIASHPQLAGFSIPVPGNLTQQTAGPIFPWWNGNQLTNIHLRPDVTWSYVSGSGSGQLDNLFDDIEDSFVDLYSLNSGGDVIVEISGTTIQGGTSNASWIIFQQGHTSTLSSCDFKVEVVTGSTDPWVTLVDETGYSGSPYMAHGTTPQGGNITRVRWTWSNIGAPNCYMKSIGLTNRNKRTDYHWIPSKGGTIYGNLIFDNKNGSQLTLAGSGGGESQLRIQADVGQLAYIGLYDTGSRARWIIGKNAADESGADAGSDLIISRYTDAGGYVEDALTIRRNTGFTQLNGELLVNNSTGISASNVALGANSNLYFHLNGTDYAAVASDGSSMYLGAIGSQIFFQSDIDFVRPLTNNFTYLGDNGLRWASVFTQDLNVSGTALFQNNVTGSTAEFDTRFTGSAFMVDSGALWEDIGADNNSRLAGIVVTGSTPVGQYPTGTIWLHTDGTPSGTLSVESASYGNDGFVVGKDSGGSEALKVDGSMSSSFFYGNSFFADSGSARIDQGATNDALVAGVVFAASAPSGQYPTGTIWIDTS